MHHRFYLLTLLVFCTGGLFAQSTDSSFGPYTDYLKSEIESNKIAGAVSLVVKDGKVVHQGAWGYSDKELGEKMKEDQIFHLMSMTKPVVSIAAMMLWEEGKFKLDDPISKYLDGFDALRVTTDASKGKDGPTVPANSVPTIRQLFSHTAGFSHGLGGTTLDNEVARGLYYSPQKNIASRVKTLTELPLLAQPGEKWSYSASPDVLALLIEKLSGQPVDEFIQERIFDPLDMQDTGYNMSAEQATRMPKLYKIVDGELVRDMMQMPANGHTVFGGTHGMLSTASDYAKFCEVLLNGGKANGHRLLKEETLALMTSPNIGKAQYVPGQTFGLGFGVSTATPKDGLGSKGQFYWSGAYSTFFFVDPANKLYAILLTQTSPYTGSHGDALRKYVYEGIQN
jgi:CubicO group peptidase (beta-lactamase class C family)